MYITELTLSMYIDFFSISVMSFVHGITLFQRYKWQRFYSPNWLDDEPFWGLPTMMCFLWRCIIFFFYFFFMYNYLFAIQEMIAYPLSAFCICKLLPFSLYDTDNSSTFIKVTVWINNCFSMWKTGKDHCRLYYKLQSRKNNGIVDIWNDWELTQTGYYGSLFPPRDKQKVIVRLFGFSHFSEILRYKLTMLRKTNWNCKMYMCVCIYTYIYSKLGGKNCLHFWDVNWQFWEKNPKYVK